MLIRRKNRTFLLIQHSAFSIQHCFALFVTWLLPLAVTSGQTTQPLNPLARRIVEDVQIRGNITVPTSLIRNVIRTQVGSKYDPPTVQEDYQRIFELKKFANVEARVEATSTGGVIVDFVVTEQKLINKITWHGNRGIDTATLEKASDIKVGQAIDSFRISMAKEAITTTYRDKNYPFTSVDVPMDPLTQRGELIFNIVEGPKVWVRNIRFVGAEHFAPDELAHQIKTSTWLPIFNAGRYDPDQVEQDIASLTRYYSNHGFFDVQVGRKLIFSPDQSELQIDFLIREGPRYIVDHISFTGNSTLSDAQLRAGLSLTPGRPYDFELNQHDVQQIVKDYSPFGRIYVQPSLTQKPDDDYLTVEPEHVYLDRPGRVELAYRIHEGKPFRLGRIIVKGNNRSQDKLVLREFRDFAPGSLYKSAAVQEAVERIRALPNFSLVNAAPQGDDPQYRNVVVTVAEKSTATLNLGGGISSNGGIQGNFSITQTNFDIANVPEDWREALSDKSFTGAGQTLRLSFNPGTIYSSADVEFIEPWLFDQPYIFSTDLYLSDRYFFDYTARRIGSSMSLGRYLDYNNEIKATLRGEQVTIYHVADEKLRAPEILEQRGTHALTSLSLAYQNQTINPGPVPYTGSVINAAVDLYGALGGAYAFQRYSAGWSQFETIHSDLLDRKWVLNERLNIGFITGRSFFLERFYAGDIGSVRGFRYQGISPRSGRANDPIGGDFQVTGTVEFTFPIYQNMFRGVLFADFGDVENDVRFGVLRASVGPGVRFTLPFLNNAPIEIDFGLPIVKARSDDLQLITFSFGTRW